MNHLSSLSDKQRETLKQFRFNVEDILTPDYKDEILLKYLRAKNFDLKNAERNLRQVEWTKITYEGDNVVDTYKFKEVFKYQADTFIGFAKDGSPIRYIKGTCDHYGFLHSLSTYELVRYYMYIFEKDIKTMEEENIRTGRNNTEITYILDLEGTSLLQFVNPTVIEIGLDCLRIMQDFYPERWGNIYAVNASYIYNKIFQLFKPIMKDTLLKNIHVVSKGNTAEFLREYIDDDVLPAFLGGKRVDSNGDIHCREFINQGGVIPKSYYLKNCEHYIEETDPGVNVVTVAARSVFNLPVIVREKGSMIGLEMRTENGSIAFCLLFREFGDDPDNPDIPTSDEYLDPYNDSCNVILVATRLRTHSHWAPNNGRGCTTNPGIYILQFDNTDSWFTSRRLYYRITVYPPGS